MEGLLDNVYSCTAKGRLWEGMSMARGQGILEGHFLYETQHYKW